MNKREYYMGLAQSAAKRSKCVSLQVGCVIVKHDRVISTGVNGTAPGAINCCEKFPAGDCAEHSAWSQKYERHAEMSALLQSTDDLLDCSIYVTHSPCFNCLKHIISCGIKEVFYGVMYAKLSQEDWIEIVDYCRDTETKLYQVQSSKDVTVVKGMDGYAIQVGTQFITSRVSKQAAEDLAKLIRSAT